MYDTSFRCTYHLIDDEIESDTLYKIQFLQAGSLNEWDDKKVNELCDEIYNTLYKNQRGIEILTRCNKWNPLSCIGDDLSMSSVILCCFELFYLTHNCMIDLLTHNEIRDETFEQIMKKLYIV